MLHGFLLTTFKQLSGCKRRLPFFTVRVPFRKSHIFFITNIDFKEPVTTITLKGLTDTSV